MSQPRGELAHDAVRFDGWRGNRKTGMAVDVKQIATHTRLALAGAGLTVVGEDLSRPWGGFLLISQADVGTFIATHFPKVGLASNGHLLLSPKVLFVAPNRRLSLQYHLRRSEVWRIIEGPVGVGRSPTDAEPPVRHYDPGEILWLVLGERHRLVGLENWGVVAEIWQHTDATAPSDEDDIARIADDFGRR